MPDGKVQLPENAFDFDWISAQGNLIVDNAPPQVQRHIKRMEQQTQETIQREAEKAVKEQMAFRKEKEKVLKTQHSEKYSELEGKYNTLTADHDRLKQQAETEKKAAEDKVNELEVQRQRLEIENTAKQRQIQELQLEVDMHKDAFNELDETHQKLLTGELQWEQQLQADKIAYAELEKRREKDIQELTQKYNDLNAQFIKERAEMTQGLQQRFVDEAGKFTEEGNKTLLGYVSQAQNEVLRYIQDNQRLQQELIKYQQQDGSIVKEHQMAQQRLAQIEAELLQKSQQLSEVETVIPDFLSAPNAMNASAPPLHTRIKQIVDDRDNYRERLEKEQLQRGNDDQARINQLEAAISNVKAQALQEIAKIEQERNAAIAQAKIDAEEKANLKAQAQIDAAKLETKQKEGEMAIEKRNAEDLQRRLDRITKESKEDIERATQRLDFQIQALKSENDVLRKIQEKPNGSQEAAEVTNRVDSVRLQGQLASKETELSTLKDQLNVKTQEAAKYQKEIMDFYKQAVEADQRLQQKSAEFDTLNDMYANMMRQMSTITQDSANYHAAHAENSQLKSQIQSYEKQLTESKQEHANLQALYDKLLEAQRQSGTTYQQANLEVIKLQARLQQVTDQYNTLKAQHDQMVEYQSQYQSQLQQTPAEPTSQPQFAPPVTAQAPDLNPNVVMNRSTMPDMQASTAEEENMEKANAEEADKFMKDIGQGLKQSAKEKLAGLNLGDKIADLLPDKEKIPSKLKEYYQQVPKSNLLQQEKIHAFDINTDKTEGNIENIDKAFNDIAPVFQDIANRSSSIQDYTDIVKAQDVTNNLAVNLTALINLDEGDNNKIGQGLSQQKASILKVNSNNITRELVYSSNLSGKQRSVEIAQKENKHLDGVLNTLTTNFDYTKIRTALIDRGIIVDETEDNESSTFVQYRNAIKYLVLHNEKEEKQSVDDLLLKDALYMYVFKEYPGHEDIKPKLDEEAYEKWVSNVESMYKTNKKLAQVYENELKLDIERQHASYFLGGLAKFPLAKKGWANLTNNERYAAISAMKLDLLFQVDANEILEDEEEEYEDAEEGEEE